MYKIIDYAGETFQGGFETCKRAYSYLYISYNTDFIHEMGFRVVKEEELYEFVACNECEERGICFEANENDGCVFGVKTPMEGGKDERDSSEL